MPKDIRKKIRERGGKVLTTTHTLAEVGRGIRNKTATSMPLEIMAQTLRHVGEETKVAVEITVMAADSGYIPMDEVVIALGGT